MFKIFQFSVSLLVMMLVIGGCRKDPKGGVVSRSKQECTPEESAIIGDELMRSIERNAATYPLLDTARYEDELEYLNRLLGSLVHTAPVINRSAFDWKIQIIQKEEEYNLFAVPNWSILCYDGNAKIGRY